MLMIGVLFLARQTYSLRTANETAQAKVGLAQLILPENDANPHFIVRPKNVIDFSKKRYKRDSSEKFKLGEGATVEDYVRNLNQIMIENQSLKTALEEARTITTTTKAPHPVQKVAGFLCRLAGNILANVGNAAVASLMLTSPIQGDAVIGAIALGAGIAVALKK